MRLHRVSLLRPSRERFEYQLSSVLATFSNAGPGPESGPEHKSSKAFKGVSRPARSKLASLTERDSVGEPRLAPEVHRLHLQACFRSVQAVTERGFPLTGLTQQAIRDRLRQNLGKEGRVQDLAAGAVLQGELDPFRAQVDPQNLPSNSFTFPLSVRFSASMVIFVILDCMVAFESKTRCVKTPPWRAGPGTGRPPDLSPDRIGPFRSTLLHTSAPCAPDKLGSAPCATDK